MERGRGEKRKVTEAQVRTVKMMPIRRQYLMGVIIPFISSLSFCY